MGYDSFSQYPGGITAFQMPADPTAVAEFPAGTVPKISEVWISNNKAGAEVVEVRSADGSKLYGTIAIPANASRKLGFGFQVLSGTDSGLSIHGAASASVTCTIFYRTQRSTAS